MYPVRCFFLLIPILFSSILLAQPSIEIYLIRHGQTDSNLFDQSQRMHTPLNQIGKEQAATAGKKLALLNICQIFSSDYLRTKQTAEILCNNLGKDIPIEYTERLREGDHGNWKEKSPSEMFNLRREYRLHCEPTREAWISFKGDGSIESYEEMYLRLKAFLINSVIPKVISRSIPQNSSIALVTHGMMIVSTLYHHLEYDPKLGFRVDNCGWVKLRLQADGTLELIDKDEEKVGSFPFP
jgi:broad specificity phosphatase PhoE